MERPPKYLFPYTSSELIKDGEFTEEGFAYAALHTLSTRTTEGSPSGLAEEVTEAFTMETDKPSIIKDQVEQVFPVNTEESADLVDMALNETDHAPDERFDPLQWQSGVIDEFNGNWHS